MNPMLLLQLKPAWEQLKTDRPELMNFVKAASRDGFMDKGILIEISITNSSGKTIAFNVRVRQEDLALFTMFKGVLEDE